MIQFFIILTIAQLPNEVFQYYNVTAMLWRRAGAPVTTKLWLLHRITSNKVLDTVLSNANLVTSYVPKPDGAVV